jgi:hypothetical protein
MLGMQTSQDAFMTVQERVDFSIIILLFGTLVGGLGSNHLYKVEYLLYFFLSQSKLIRNPDRSDHGEFFSTRIYPVS